MKQNIHNRTYITIRIRKDNNKIHNLQNYTTAYKTYNHIYNDKKGTERTRKKVINEKAIQTANFI